MQIKRKQSSCDLRYIINHPTLWNVNKDGRLKVVVA